MSPPAEPPPGEDRPSGPPIQPRKIIHLDMDCFFAAVELRERPDLAGRPVAVGGSSGRGVLTTCNYEARRFGCHSAMPVFQAVRLCPHLVVLPVRFERYREESRRVREILRAVTPLVEPLSLDEAFIDVTGHRRYAWDIAKELRAEIHETTGLTASAGVAPNKMLAKIASDWNKPNGQFAVLPEDVEAFMEALPVGKIWGVGPVSRARLEALGASTCGQLKAFSPMELERRFGRFGRALYRLCRGIDDRAVEPDQVRKSLSNERTFDRDLTTLSACGDALEASYAELVEDLAKLSPPRPVDKLFVKLKFSDFRRTTRECLHPTPDLGVFQGLLADAYRRRGGRDVRLLGAGVRFADLPVPGRPVQLELDYPAGGGSLGGPGSAQEDAPRPGNGPGNKP